MVYIPADETALVVDVESVQAEAEAAAEEKSKDANNNNAINLSMK